MVVIDQTWLDMMIRIGCEGRRIDYTGYGAEAQLPSQGTVQSFDDDYSGAGNGASDVPGRMSLLSGPVRALVSMAHSGRDGRYVACAPVRPLENGPDGRHFPRGFAMSEH